MKAIPIFRALSLVFFVIWVVGVAGTLLFLFLTKKHLALGSSHVLFSLGALYILLDLIWFTGPVFAASIVSIVGIIKPYSGKILKYGTFLCIVLFLVFAILASRLPELKGTAWNVRYTLIQAGAIFSGVFSLIGLLASCLPFIFNSLENQGVARFVGARHVRSKKSGFLTVISLLSIGAVALSSCSLCATTSVMGGFSSDLRRKILGNNAHITVDMESASPFLGEDELLLMIRALPGVLGATPFVQGEVMAQSHSNLAGVVLKGMDPESLPSVIDLVKNIEVGQLDYVVHPEKLEQLPPNEVVALGPHGEEFRKSESYSFEEKLDLPEPGSENLDPAVKSALLAFQPLPGIVVGRELAKTLHLSLGDIVSLVSPMGDLGPMGILPRMKRFRVAAIFYSGMYEYDATQIYTDMETAKRFLSIQDKVSMLAIKVENAENVDAVAASVHRTVEEVRPDLRVRDWREMNKNLFSALKLEKIVMFLMLTVMILIGAFCIICTLLLVVTERTREISIMKAMGASHADIKRIFMVEGLFTGAIGATLGVTLGVSLCLFVKWFGLKLDPEVYYIDRLPVAIVLGDYLFIVVVTIVICALATVVPARLAANISPVKGLTNE